MDDDIKQEGIHEEPLLNVVQIKDEIACAELHICNEFKVVLDKYIDEPYDIENFVKICEEVELKKDVQVDNEVKDILNDIVNSVCVQCCYDEVKSQDVIKGVVNDGEKDNKKEEEEGGKNEEIVIHVGALSDGHRLPIIPKVPEFKVPDLIVPEIKDDSEPGSELIVEPPPTPEQGDPIAKVPLWMPQPPVQPNCPSGLEYLSVIDTVKISQTRMLPTYNQPSFTVCNNSGQYIYEVDARSNCFPNFLCASRKRFEMSILNQNHIEVMHFSRPSLYHGRRTMEIFAPFDTLIGKVNEGRGPLPFFVIMDATNEVLFRIEVISGPPNTSLYTFGIMPTDGDSLVGKIKQESNGTFRKIFRKNFITIHYYINLDAKIKALILGASFLIDLMYFEVF